jgi:hypothetical protein
MPQKGQVVLQLWQEMVVDARENFSEGVARKVMLRRDIVPSYPIRDKAGRAKIEETFSSMARGRFALRGWSPIGSAGRMYGLKPVRFKTLEPGPFEVTAASLQLALQYENNLP